MTFLIFTIIVFISEIIIASAIIKRILAFDNDINRLNKSITHSKIDIITTIRDVRVVIQDVLNSFTYTISYLIKKRHEYVIDTIKAVVLGLSYLCLRGKYKKMALIYNLMMIAKSSYDEIYNSL